MKMLIAYDIANDKLRTRFSKFLSKFGRRVQYSVFEINNSNRLLRTISVEIEEKYGRKFEQSDSVLIYLLSKTCKKVSFGYAKNDDDDLIIV